MSQRLTATFARIAFALVGLVVVLALAGCGSKGSSDAKMTSAIDGLEIARSAVTATMAPDAKFLVVQTPSAISAGMAPIWQYTFGSPKTGKAYVVTLDGDKVMHATEGDAVGLDESEWSQVPDTADWKIDSAEAFDTALEEAGITGVPRSYSMLMETYVPKSAQKKEKPTKPFVWYVGFEAETGSGADTVVLVDATTGEVTK